MVKARSNHDTSPQIQNIPYQLPNQTTKNNPAHLLAPPLGAGAVPQLLAGPAPAPLHALLRAGRARARVARLGAAVLPAGERPVARLAARPLLPAAPADDGRLSGAVTGSGDCHRARWARTCGEDRQLVSVTGRFCIKGG